MYGTVQPACIIRSKVTGAVHVVECVAYCLYHHAPQSCQLQCTLRCDVVYGESFSRCRSIDIAPDSLHALCMYVGGVRFAPCIARFDAVFTPNAAQLYQSCTSSHQRCLLLCFVCYLCECDFLNGIRLYSITVSSLSHFCQR